jgi:hypothetical protein
MMKAPRVQKVKIWLRGETNEPRGLNKLTGQLSTGWMDLSI